MSPKLASSILSPAASNVLLRILAPVEVSRIASAASPLSSLRSPTALTMMLLPRPPLTGPSEKMSLSKPRPVVVTLAPVKAPPAEATKSSPAWAKVTAMSPVAVRSTSSSAVPLSSRIAAPLTKIEPSALRVPRSAVPPLETTIESPLVAAAIVAPVPAEAKIDPPEVRVPAASEPVLANRSMKAGALASLMAIAFPAETVRKVPASSRPLLRTLPLVELSWIAAPASASARARVPADVTMTSPAAVTFAAVKAPPASARKSSPAVAAAIEVSPKLSRSTSPIASSNVLLAIAPAFESSSMKPAESPLSRRRSFSAWTMMLLPRPPEPPSTPPIVSPSKPRPVVKTVPPVKAPPAVAVKSSPAWAKVTAMSPVAARSTSSAAVPLARRMSPAETLISKLESRVPRLAVPDVVEMKMPAAVADEMVAPVLAKASSDPTDDRSPASRLPVSATSWMKPPEVASLMSTLLSAWTCTLPPAWRRPSLRAWPALESMVRKPKALPLSSRALAMESIRMLLPRPPNVP